MMPLEKSLLQVLAEKDDDAARRLIVPWTLRRFPSSSGSLDEGYFPGMFPPIFHESMLADMREMPAVSRVIFDENGRYHDEPPQNIDAGIVNLVIGLVPPDIVKANTEGVPVTRRGQFLAFSRQYVFLNMFYEKLFGIWPMLSGHKPVSSNRPIQYFAKNLPNPEVEILIPTSLLFEAPKVSIVYLS